MRRHNRTPETEYLEFIRSLPCVICVMNARAQRSTTEAAHVGERGLMQKCSDRETAPLCANTTELDGIQPIASESASGVITGSTKTR